MALCDSETDFGYAKLDGIDCTPTSNPTECFIAEPIQYKYGDHLQLNAMNSSEAAQILEFSVTFDARMETIPSTIWTTFPNLEQLKLIDIELRMLHCSDFENALHLHNLTLGYNNLTHIQSMLFSRAVQLMEINLEANQIQRIEDFAFNGLYQLYYLSLSRNHIVTLSSSVFSGAMHLIELRLEHNLISTLEPGVFDLPDLMFLYLSNNQLKTLPGECFKNTQLIGLDLQSNDLMQVGNATYTPNTIRTLILSDNGQINDLNVTRIKAELPNLHTFKYDSDINIIS